MLSLYENERLDEVNDKLRLIQKNDGLTFGTDALLLAAFASKRANRALELGGGTGIISLLLAARNRFSQIDCIEIQPTFVDLIERNVTLNGLSEHIHARHADVREFPAKKDFGTYDVVFTNPPYMKTDAGAACLSEEKEIARHEHCGDINDFVRCAASALRFGGAFYIVYRPDRLADLICALRTASLEPKRLCFVSARAELPPSMLLLEARRGGKAGMTVTPPLIITENGKDSPDMEYILTRGLFPEKYERSTACQASRK